VTAPAGITFVIPTLDAGPLLGRCLTSIREQDHPRDLVEILVADGGSTDGTQALAEAHGARVVHNPMRRAEPGVKLGFSLASHEIRVVLAADNGLPGRDWITRVLATFEETGARGVYTHVVDGPGDKLTCRWFNRMHADPLNWFAFGARRSHPARFTEVYPTVRRGSGWELLDLGVGPRPLLALAQGFAIRGELPDDPLHTEDDIAPLWAAMAQGEHFAYCDVGVWHETVLGMGDFAGKYRRRTASSLDTHDAPAKARAAMLTRGQRMRRILFPVYAASVVLPVADAVRGLARDRDRAWLLHPVGCLVLLASIGRGVLDARARSTA
jgi:hypothetical protein